MFRKLLDQGQAGDNVGVLLRGTKREEVERGQVLAKPGSITRTPTSRAKCMSCRRMKAAVTPFFNNYRPQFYFRTTDVTGAIQLPEGTEMVMPGDNIAMTVKLIAPIAMEEGLRFCHPRRRSYRRRRRRGKDHRVSIYALCKIRGEVSTFFRRPLFGK